MSKLLIRICMLLALIAGALFLYFRQYGDGYIDPFYVRFTAAPANSLILGTSRAAQGLHPAVFNTQLKNSGIDLPVFNYSFTIEHSPYGPYYLESIKKKLNPNTKQGIFIITIDPWAISSKTDTTGSFREANLCIGNMRFVNWKPNFEYLFFHYEHPLFRMATIDRENHPLYLHHDGWLEVRVTMDSMSLKKNIEAKLEMYRNNLVPRYQFSPLRFSYLEKTITYLQQHGIVYLVRLPVSPQMAALELQFMPDFDKKIEDMAQNLRISYFNFIHESSKYQTTDGNHLDRRSGEEVSKKVCLYISRDNKSS